jgi:hypothetical protein
MSTVCTGLGHPSVNMRRRHRCAHLKAAPTEDLRAELNRRRAGEDTPVSLERPDDLRAKLNRRRTGEDARVSLERARERRQNIEGRNLDLDFTAVAPQTPRGARVQGVSHWLAWAAPHWRIISAQRLSHPSSSHTCRKSTTVRQIRWNSCRYTSPLLRQQVETLL